MTIKLTIHSDRGKYVVNTPGHRTGVAGGNPPRTYTTLERALRRIRELAEH